ncbi:MAG TPA: 50S ribosomal protein L29 [Chloroflexi bacterium]|jgi:large subunit ribosomal protein L29|nr:50S ribosomal protein L29 [Chloroflexota bacterium]HPO57926.1 50S ribosomal protein L29 [Anaerolineaceae bacterium]
MKPAQIRQLTTEEIRSRLEDARHELMNLRFQVVTGQQTDTSRMKKTRRLIARFETILRERELAESRGAK